MTDRKTFETVVSGKYFYTVTVEGDDVTVEEGRCYDGNMTTEEVTRRVKDTDFMQRVGEALNEKHRILHPEDVGVFEFDEDVDFQMNMVGVILFHLKRLNVDYKTNMPAKGHVDLITNAILPRLGDEYGVKMTCKSWKKVSRKYLKWDKPDRAPEDRIFKLSWLLDKHAEYVEAG